jgi:release factor glutamine methyltransferase
MEAARRIGRRLAHRLLHAHALRQIAKPVARLYGRTLMTDPQVFHPVYFLSTRVLVDYIATLDLGGRRFLDMGTGSGAVGIFAALRGAAVTACDVNPRAVEVAAANARRNGVGMEVLESNLFAALPGRTFDLVAFNLPFYPRDPETPFDAALCAGRNFETIAGFAAGCQRALAPEGRVVALFSEDSGRDRMLSMFESAAFTVEEELTRTRWFERFHVLRLRRSGRSPLSAVEQR